MSYPLVQPGRKNIKARSDLILLSIVAVTGFILALIFDVCEKIIEFLLDHRAWRIDELLVVVIVLAVAFCIYSVRRWLELKLEIAEREQAQEALQVYLRRLENLREIDLAILAAQSTKAIVEVALHHLQELVVCYKAEVVVLNIELNKQTPKEAALIISVTKGKETIVEKEPALSPQFLEILDKFSQGQSLIACQSSGLPGSSTLPDSHLILPLICEGNLMGVLNLEANPADSFNPEHLNIAQEVAVHLAVAIQNARLFEQVQAGRERLQVLSHRLVEAQETERRAIAHELHDEVGQALTAVKINLQASRHLSDAGLRQSQLDESIGIVEQTLQHVRNISLDLRPAILDDLGLAVALRWYVERTARRVGFSTDILIELFSTRLPIHLETVCFRVAQEALTNITRHAKAKQVRVELRLHQDELILLVQDDGVGFELKTALEQAVRGASLGLLGMQERLLTVGGWLKIEARPGDGCQIVACFPCPLPQTSNITQLELRSGVRQAI